MKQVQVLDSNNIKKIYFVGIKGVGMVGLALIARQAGFEVAGSDVSEEFLTDKVLAEAKIRVDLGFDTSHIEEFIKSAEGKVLVITTAAHNGLLNPQCEYARAQNIPILTHGQAVGYFMQGDLFSRVFKGISILGCHGKTTISAMVSAALTKAELDPTYTVGTSEIFPGMLAGHYGLGEYFAAEADEFISDIALDKTVKFLYQHPKYAILNNIDFDHPDVYRNLEDVIEVFKKFSLENVLQNGVIFANGDDVNLQHILESVKKDRTDVSVVTYGENQKNTFSIQNFRENGLGSAFDVYLKGEFFENIQLSVPGFYNAKNSLAVVALLYEIGVSKDSIKASIAYFKGTKRRQEEIGNTSKGLLVIDDYAHHPDEIDKTLTAIKKAFPHKKLIAMFQPHTISRTESLKKEFAQAFSSSDTVIFLPIFTSKREGEMDYSHIYSEIQKAMQESGLEVVFMPDSRQKEDQEYSPYFLSSNRAPVVKYIEDHFNSEDFVLVTLGAGDIYKIAYDLVRT